MRNILEFEQAFPDVTTILLEQNYRSTQTILDAANAVIEQQRVPQAEGAVDRVGAAASRIVRYHADDEGDEAQWVAHTIADLHDGGDYRWGDVAVFYRTNAQSRVVEEAPHAGGHPVQGHRRHQVLRPAGDQGRPRLPARRRQPGRRGAA